MANDKVNYAVKPDSTSTITIGGVKTPVYTKIMPDKYYATKDVASYVKKGQPLKPCKKMYTGKPLGITVHNTGDIDKLLEGISSAAEQYVLSTYNCNMGGSIVHYYVSDGAIWQLLDNNEQAWHSGTGNTRSKIKNKRDIVIGGNTDTISIECVGNSTGAEKTTAMLVAYLCKLYGFDPELDVYTHKEWSGKHCPTYILPHWSTFIGNVKEYLRQGESVTSVPETKIYRVQCGAFGLRTNADKMASELKAKKFETMVVQAVVNGKTVYRVQVGAFTVKANADAKLAEVKKLGSEYKNAFIV